VVVVRPVTPPLIDVAIAAAPLDGASESGDAAVVVDFPGRRLIAGIDGLGHGPEAAQAAHVIAEQLREVGDRPLPELVQCCHDAARSTRGAVLTLVAFEGQGRLRWLAVGNVDGVLVRADGRRHESVIARPGIVGSSLPPMRETVLEIARGDTVVLATDGLCSGFARSVRLAEPPQACAERILSDYARGGDDALVIVARHGGEDGHRG
jgi:negative regulator of sigma-B (phosphoserine phosphatase)